jgi:hypothetical protein
MVQRKMSPTTRFIFEVSMACRGWFNACIIANAWRYLWSPSLGLGDKSMSEDELAEELADFWFSALADAGWEDRLGILREIHAQLRIDIETRAEYDAVSPRFVAAVIDRLGAPAVENAAQAEIYAISADERHRDAARAWSQGTQPSDPLGQAGDRADRRRSPRRTINAISEMWVQGQQASCRLVDLSEGGARLVVREPVPRPGTQLRVAVPDAGIRDAMVVFRSAGAIGVQFVDQRAAA